MQVCFLDTSVLTNILDVPGKNQQREEVKREYRRRRDQAWHLILPVTAVIETGNHIEQLADGAARRACGQRFVEVLERVIGGEAPFVLHEVGWDGSFLGQLVAGAGTQASLIEHLTR